MNRPRCWAKGPARSRVCASLLLIAACSVASSADDRAGVAFVRHSPSLHGAVDGSVWQMLPESVTLNGGASISGDLMVPGTPSVRLNGKPSYGGTVDADGSSIPAGFQVTLNGGVSLARVVRRVDAIPIVAVAAPPLPAGRQSPQLSATAQTVGSWSDVRHLTMNTGADDVALPPGSYGDVTLNGGTGVRLGQPGASEPAVYNLQRLNLGGQARVDVVGPIVLTVAHGFAANGVIGASARPDWLLLNVYSGGVTLNGDARIHGYVNAPTGSVVIHGGSHLVGGVSSDRLVVHGGGLLRILTPVTQNLPPVARPDAVTVDEDTPMRIALAGTDPEGAPLSYVILSLPSRGVLHTVDGPVTSAPTAGLSDPVLVYLPHADVTGDDGFRFAVHDGESESPPAVVGIQVLPVNDAPVVAIAPIVVDEDAINGATVSLLAVDVDSSVFDFTIVAGPSHGRLLPGSGDAERIYRPDTDFHGLDGFTVVASDGGLQSEPMTVPITVRPVNDPPVALDRSLLTREETPLDLELSGFDADGDALTFVQLSGPIGGELVGTGATLRYVPDRDFTGLDWFDFAVRDGEAESAPATVWIDVGNENDAPEAVVMSVATEEDSEITISLRATDADGDPVSLSIVRQARFSQGELVVADGVVTYRPLADFAGIDSFSFKATDIFGADSAEAVVSIEVVPVNDPPRASAQTLVIREDQAVDLVLTGSDTEDAVVQVAIVDPPSRGELVTSVPEGPWRYVPEADYHGADAFTFRVRDSGGLYSDAATVSISIEPVNDVPVPSSQHVAVDEDQSVAIELAATDAEGDMIRYEVVAPPRYGVLEASQGEGESPVFVYTPAENYHGPDGFTFVARDADASQPASIEITVAPINDAPQASAPEIITDRNVPVSFTLGMTDADGDVLGIEIAAPPSHGTLLDGEGESLPLPIVDWTSPNFGYSPGSEYAGPDTFTFRVRDPHGSVSSDVEVAIEVRATNRAPRAVDGQLTVDEDAVASVVLEAHDADGNPLTYVVTAPPMHGTLTGEGAVRNYSPDSGYAGPDAFSFKVHDGSEESTAATVRIEVIPRDDPPSADDLNVATDEDSPLAITLAGHDAEGAALTFEIISGPRHGTLTGEGAIRLYTPASDYNGADSFTYQVRADGVASLPGTVGIVVRPVADPIALSMEVAASGGGWISTQSGVSLQVQATSADGHITRAEWYDGDVLIGARTEDPFVLEWMPQVPGIARIWVRVIDSVGGVADSEVTEISVLAGLPYSTDFEAGEGYETGGVGGQRGWTAQGTSLVSRLDSASGENSLLLTGGPVIPDATQVIAPGTGAGIVFIDFFARLSAGDAPDNSVVFDGQAALLASVAGGDGAGELRYWRRDGLGSGDWQPTGFSYSIDGTRTALAWHRITLRKDFLAKEWDVYVDGRMLQGALPFLDDSVERLARLMFVGPAAGPAHIDDVYAGMENPLFGDVDRDGIDDDFEVVHGMDSRADDRHGDVDADGLSNLDEYIRGEIDVTLDSDDDGMPDHIERAAGLDPLDPSDAIGDLDRDGVSNLAEYRMGRSLTRGVVPDPGGAVRLRVFLPR